MKKPIHLPLLVAVATAFATLAGCGTAPVAGSTAAAAAARPRLVVLLVVDGFPQRQVTDYRDQLGPDGLNRFLERGAWFADAHYGHGFTVTAAGHATMLTGAYPNRTGIIGNEWRDPTTGAATYNTGDESHTYLGHKTARLDGTSPRNLRAESLGDVLKGADPRSKIVAISGKDRGAILPAGKAGTAYMYMRQTGRFASSTYYMKAHPPWVEAWNGAKPSDRYLKAEWKPLLPEMAYLRSVPDAQSWFAPGGKLPRVMGEKLDEPGPLLYEALYQSPFLDALSLDFARAAIAGEALGEDDAPDILSVSLSGHDYINHAWGAESRLSHDHVLQLDNLFAAFFRDLDRQVGKDNYLVLLTADHGFMPAPAYSKSKGVDAGMQSSSQSLARLNAALAKRFGEGTWALAWSAQSVQLDNALIAARGVDPRALEEEARRALLAEPGLVAAFTRAEILDPATPAAPYLDAVRKAYYPGRSGDIQAVLKPHWMFASSRSTTTHGSPHPYDTHVPILAWGPKWVSPGRRDGRVEVVDIAPTLSRILGVRPPAAAEGKPLPVGP